VITKLGGGENKQTFVPLFLLKETEEVKEKTKQRMGEKATNGRK